MMDAGDIAKYNAVRRIDVRDKLCHAPTVSLNFEQNGNVTACCFNRSDVLGRYPEQSIADIWNGKALNQLRKHIDQKKLDGGCKLCRILIESGNYQGTKAIHYDEYAIAPSKLNRVKGFLGLMERPSTPRVFEFEISNTCNLECEMCNGYFSSTIRKNREKLPPLNNPYDDAFVDQVAEFMPGLTDLKFLGGEPFLVEVYYKIWERVSSVNPNIKIHITTNGTVFNNKVKKIMSSLRAGLVISLDSVDPEEFESIRIGAKFERVMANFNEFLELTRANNTYLSIAACAMSNNWKGIPNLVRFANDKNVPLHFNVVWNPGHLSMRYLSHELLTEIDAYFSEQVFLSSSAIERMNKKAFEELRSTINHWKNERSQIGLDNLDSFENVTMVSPELLVDIPNSSPEFINLATQLMKQYAWAKPTIKEQLTTIGFIDDSEPEPIKPHLFDLWKANSDSWFFSLYFEVVPLLAGAFYGSDCMKETEQKCQAILAHVTDMRKQQAIVSDLIDDIDRRSVVNHLQLITGNSTERLLAHIDENY